MTVIADTGALYALMDTRDEWHSRVIAWWRQSTAAIVVPVTVLPEVTYLLQKRIGVAAEDRFVRAVADGEFEIEQLEAEDLSRAADLVTAYRDLPLGFVDATVISMAERLEARELLTTDRRHFSVVRPVHTRKLLLLP